MNDLALEELISAYVDGELTAEEQARVELAIAQNARCRQLYDEFVAMRASLQALPRVSLDPGFSKRVLERIREIEAEKAVGPAAENPVSLGRPANGEIIRIDEAESKTAASSHAEAGVELGRGRWPRGGSRYRMAWIGAAAAALVLALYLSAGHLGLHSLLNDDHEFLGANSSSGDPREPIPESDELLPDGPSPALAENEAPPDRRVSEMRPQNVANGNFAAPEESPTRVARGNDNPPRNVPDMPVAPETTPENAIPPQLARTAPTVNSADVPPRRAAEDRSLVAVGPGDLTVDYGSRDLHVIRLMASAAVLGSRELDEILEREGISFRVAAGRVNGAGAKVDGDRPPPEVDIVLVRGVPAQIDGVLDELGQRSEAFRPLAVYTAPQDRILDWILAVVENLPSVPLDPAPAPPTESLPDDVTPRRASEWSGYLELSSDPTQKVFAWRAPPLNRDVLDRLFPVPSKQEAPAARTRPLTATEVPPDRTVQVIFLVFRAP